MYIGFARAPASNDRPMIVAMAMKSKRKGSAGEREAASAVATHLRIHARRSRQYCGTAGDSDLTLDAPIAVEVKRYAKIAAMRFLNQAERDSASSGDLPIVVMREDGDTRWSVLLRLEDCQRFAALLVAAETNQLNKAQL